MRVLIQLELVVSAIWGPIGTGTHVRIVRQVSTITGPHVQLVRLQGDNVKFITRQRIHVNCQHAQRGCILIA